MTPLLDLFFPDAMNFDTETVNFDIIDAARRLAPFVSPNVAGRPMRQRGFKTRTFTPPYIKPKHVIEPNKQMKRRAGERLTGSMSPAERFDAATAETLALQEEQIARREEWMASQLLRTGSVVCVGEDFPSQTIDLGRNAAHTVQLSGAARWNQSGVSPYNDLKTWATTVATRSGVHPGTVVMDPLACSYLQKDPDVRALLALPQTTPDTVALRLLGVSTGAQGDELIRIGKVGNFEIYQYSAIYTDDDGNVSNFMPSNTVIMGSRKLAEGIRLYGAIMDARSLKPLARFPKQWEQEDPSVVFTMTQSAPLPIIRRPDATFCATVV